MCDLTFIGRATDGLILCETWDDLTTNPSFISYKQQAKDIIKCLDPALPRCSVDSQGYTFHYMVDLGVCYMTLCERSYPKKLAFTFLDEIQRLFVEELKREFGSSQSLDYRSLVETIEKPYYFIKFDRVIQRKKQDYRDPRSDRAVDKLNESLTEVTSIMRKNITDILHRGENLEDVGRKASELKYASKQFAGMTRRLSYQAMLQQYAPCIIIALVVLVIICWKLWF
eukprot:GHVQ01005100.1.p1 GENE.GHVQ01005100.1~~GHVQ01005100.1.p1  ORF type:complete len:227 (+),score=26.01 GHVQ01005100.1:324-1004(+)